MPDAWTVVRNEQSNNTKVWKENKRVLQEEGVVHAFNSIWRKEKRRHWFVLTGKRKRRVNFLSEKFGSKGEIDCVTEVEGITLANHPTPPTFSSSPRCHGGVRLTSEEEKVLCLPQKFAVYDKVDLTSCKAQIEKGLAKLHWSVLRNANVERDERGEVEEDKEEERVWPFDLKNGTFDLRHLRPTDLPFKKRVFL